MKSEDQDVTIGGGYPFGQLAQAFATALEHENPETRQRALGRIDQWTAVLKGMASGKLSIGSRTPVTDLPAWVTPEVVRGGFATGAAAAASGKLEPWEKKLALMAGSRETRSALFAHSLTEEGLAELDGMLTSGAYAVDIPEEAALLSVAWLARAGHADAAIALVQTLAPHSDRLRFAPRPAEPDLTPRSVVCRQTVGETSRALGKRKLNARVETMREALTVWNPFGDEMLELWLETVEDDRVGAVQPLSVNVT